MAQPASCFPNRAALHRLLPRGERAHGAQYDSTEHQTPFPRSSCRHFSSRHPVLLRIPAEACPGRLQSPVWEWRAGTEDPDRPGRNPALPLYRL